MTNKSKNPCLTCDCWDSDAQGCTMPHYDRWYACPIDSERPENKKALEENGGRSCRKKGGHIMTKELAMEYLKKAAEVVKVDVDLGKLEDEGRQLFCTGRDIYEIHMYDNNSFIDMAKALEKPFSIDPDWSENKGYCKFYTPIDGFGEREWEIFTLFDKEKGWPNAK